MGQPVTRRSDVYAAAVVLWEALAGQRLFAAESEGNVLRRIMDGVIDRPSQHAPDLPKALEDVVMKGLAKEPADRYDTALAMADAIESAVAPAPARAIGQWLQELARDRLRARAELVASIECSSAGTPTGQVEAAPPPGDPTLVDDAERAHTSVSVASDREKVPPPRRLSFAWAVVGGIAVGGGIATAYVVGHDSGRTAAIASPAPPSASLAVAAVPPAASAAPTPTVTVSSPPAASIVPTPPTASATPAPARPAPRPPRPRPATAPAPQGTGTGLYSRE